MLTGSVLGQPVPVSTITSSVAKTRVQVAVVHNAEETVLSMPTDHVKNRTFKETLSGSVRFKVPFFQRGYAWEKKQWDQLFLDIQEQIIEELERGSALDEVEHFFGPIVVMEQMGPPEVREFLVVDGQQRITTVYLLLGIIRDQIRAKKHLSGDAHAYLDELKKYVFNDVAGADD